MTLHLTPPTDDAIGARLAEQSALPFSYEPVGATGGPPPDGWRRDHNRVRLGRGISVFRRARAALESWSMFDTGWTRLLPLSAPIREGTVVAVVARTLGITTVNPCRIVYTFDLELPDGRAWYGFAYGTLPEHVARGEERFLVEHRRDDDSVWFEVLAFSKPGHPLVKLGYPYMRMCQRRFARDAKRAMVRAVS